MKTIYNNKKHILATAISIALSLPVKANTHASEFMKVQPAVVYQSAAGVPLRETLEKVATRSGIVFKFNADISKDILLKTVSADSWETAISQLFEGYNFAVIKAGNNIEKVIIAGRGQFGAIKNAPMIEESKLITVTPMNEILPIKYQAYPAGSVVKVDLPVKELMDIADATDITLNLPLGKMAVTHSRTVSEQDGSRTWVGYLKNEGTGYHVFISEGKAGVMGHVLSPEGTYTLETTDRELYIVDVNKLKDVGFDGDILPNATIGNAELADTAVTPDPNTPTSVALTNLTNLAKLVSDAQAAYNAAVAAVPNAQKSLDTATNAIPSLQNQVTLDTANLNSITISLSDATKQINITKASVILATNDFNTVKAAIEAETMIKNKLEAMLVTANTNLQAAKATSNAAAAAYSSAETAYNNSPTAKNLAARTAAQTANVNALNAYLAASTAFIKASSELSRETLSVYGPLNTKVILSSSALNTANKGVASANALLTQRQAIWNSTKAIYDKDVAALNAAKLAITVAQSKLIAAQKAVTDAKIALDAANLNYKAALNDSTDASEIDVMVLYTTKSQSTDFAKQRINYLITASNQSYADSGVKMSLRLVHTEPTSYVENNSNLTALYDLARNVGAFAGIESIRAKYGADLVYLFRPLWAATASSCGTTFVEFANGTAPSYSLGYGTISDGTGKDISTSYCRINTFTHEIGHSLGLVHDIEYSNAAGVFPDAYAWGVNGKFATIMSYKMPMVMLFSNPDLSTQCAGQPCGTATANQAKALRYTAPIVSKFLAKTTVTPVLN